jgi:hypothetical protein
LAADFSSRHLLLSGDTSNCLTKDSRLNEKNQDFIIFAFSSTLLLDNKPLKLPDNLWVSRLFGFFGKKFASWSKMINNSLPDSRRALTFLVQLHQ